MPVAVYNAYATDTRLPLTGAAQRGPHRHHPAGETRWCPHRAWAVRRTPPYPGMPAGARHRPVAPGKRPQCSGSLSHLTRTPGKAGV